MGQIYICMWAVLPRCVRTLSVFDGNKVCREGVVPLYALNLGNVAPLNLIGGRISHAVAVVGQRARQNVEGSLMRGSPHAKSSVSLIGHSIGNVSRLARGP